MKVDDISQSEAFEVLGANRPGPWLITCDHAENTVPTWVNGGDLGLAAADMERHIAFDIGAAGVTHHLSEMLDAPAVLSRFSRLVIDPNRGADDPTLIMQLYDGTIIPGNNDLDTDARKARKSALYDPYHNAISSAVNAKPLDDIYLAIHSFTPRLSGKPPRPWEIAILFAQDRRFSDVLIAKLKAQGDLTVGKNEPYTGALRGDSVYQHALSTGRPNALIEIRNDLIATPNDQRAWAKRLAPILEDARKEMQM